MINPKVFDDMTTSERFEWKEKFEAYKKCQAEGRYNMVMDANLAAKRIGIPLYQYLFILKNYDSFKEVFG